MKKVFFVLALLALLLLPARPAHAWNGPLEGRVVIGESFTLKSGETLSGDLVVLGGTAVVEKGAVVEGSIVIIGGSLKLDGEAQADIVLIGAQADLGDTARVAGDLVPVGSQLERAEKAFIGGSVITNIPAPQIQIQNEPGSITPPSLPPPSQFEIDFHPFWELANVFFRAFAVAALAMLVIMFLQPQVERVSQTIVAQPFLAASVGLLTVPLALAGMAILALTILLIPVAFVVAIALVLAWLFGIIALGQEVGERFAQATHQTWAPVLTAGFGAFLLMLVVGAVGLVPCVGWLMPLLTGFLGLGGVMMTWFGTRAFYRPVLAAPPAVAGPGEPPPAAS
jgi:hypothetical protein